MSRAAGRWQIADAVSKNVRPISTTSPSASRVRSTRTPLTIVPTMPLPPITTLVPGLARELAPLRAIARGAAPVVVLGETGTGKEIAARAIHATSERRGAFVPVNCAAARDPQRGDRDPRAGQPCA